MGQALLRHLSALHPQLTRWRRDRLGRAGPETPIIAVSMGDQEPASTYLGNHLVRVRQVGAACLADDHLRTVEKLPEYNAHSCRAVLCSAGAGDGSAFLYLGLLRTNQRWLRVRSSKQIMGCECHLSMMMLPTQPAIFI